MTLRLFVRLIKFRLANYFSSEIAVALSLNKHKGLTDVDFSLSPYWAVTENDDRQVVMVQGLTKQELDNYNV